jgi:pimeloyl-ACP methyl ester carboxylesterase
MVIALAASGAFAGQAAQEVGFTARDGVPLRGLYWAGGPHAVVLAHGGVFDKESWSAQAEALVAVGLSALAFDFRGYGDGEPTYGLPGKENDVLGAIDYLVERGHERISVVGGSMGAQFAMTASAHTDRIDRLLLLAPGSEGAGAAIRARSTLFVVAANDRLRERVDLEYAAAPQPKRLEILPGSAHAQHLFATDQAAALTRLIVEFLTAD